LAEAHRHGNRGGIVKVSFVIPVTRPDFARELVLSLVRNIPESEREIVLVSGRPVPGTEDCAHTVTTDEKHASIRRNLGVKSSSGHWICFLDDDTLPEHGWFDVFREMIADKVHIVTGPTVPMTDSFQERLTDMVTTSPIGEGSLLYGRKDRAVPSFSSIYLCNCLIRREVWESVGGFNEIADWRVDDTEFFYIAVKKGFKPMIRRHFVVRHKRRGFFSGFLRHQLKARYATGMNTILFPEIFLRIPGVAFMIAGLLFLPAILFSSRLALAAAGLYLAALAADMLLNLMRKGPAALLLPVCHVSHHMVIGAAFTAGLFFTMLRRGSYREVIACKKERFKGL
jgi:glycosyltransferase involved in cell wall biosynthesis